MSRTLDAVRRVPIGIYKAQLDALEKRDLREMLFSEQATQQVADEVAIGELLEIFGDTWPLREKRIPSSRYLSEKSADGTEVFATDLLKELVREGARVGARLSHASRRQHRGIYGLETNWRELHRKDFARLGLEFLASFCLPKASNGESEKGYRDLPLNVLVVDNEPEQIFTYNEFLPPELGFGFWRKARWHVVREDFAALLSALGNSAQEREFNVNTLEANADPRDPKSLQSGRINPGEIDLIIQDYSLGNNQLAGSDLARAYLEHIPQALVFLTTGLPAETLTATEALRGVDRLLEKPCLAALPWYYHLAFRGVLGAAFWESWLGADEGEQTPFLERRSTLRSLLGSIRRWQHEPEILWHGQALPEMVDHGHQHISDLWRLTNEILGARKPDLSPALTLQALPTSERVLVALGVWLHDIGHRGDEFCVDSASIREAHGSISERLLLGDPGAFGLGWLREGQTSGENGPADGDLWSLRNVLPNSDSSLSAIRMVGLLCRHHQSSAPLFADPDHIADLHFNLKFPSDYARTATVANSETPEERTDVVAAWRDPTSKTVWMGTDIRVLEDFLPAGARANVDLMRCACLLRLLDALHVTRHRAGGEARLATHAFFRKNREKWVDQRLKELEALRRDTSGATAVGRAIGDEILSLNLYRDLLGVQDVHLWRQAVVESVTAKLSGDGKAVEVLYRVRPVLCPLKDEVKKARGPKEKSFCKELPKWLKSEASQLLALEPEADPVKAAFRSWLITFLDDVLGAEVRGQVVPKGANGILKEAEGETYLATRLFRQDGPTLRIVASCQGPDRNEVVLAQIPSEGWTTHG